MKEVIPLTEEQQKKTEETLERIKEGLDCAVESQFEEAAHVFMPEAFDVERS